VSSSVFSQGKQVFEAWYTYIQEDSFDGYMHLIAIENRDSYNLSVQLKVKTADNELIFYDMATTNLKDEYLTVKKFSAKMNGEGGERVFGFNGEIEKEDDMLKWKITNKENLKNISIETKYPTVDYFSMFYLLSKLDYSEKGRILSYNSMETSELNYKENHHVDYLEDEIIDVEGEKIKTKKITINGDGIGESTYWLNEKNELVKAAVDNYKIMQKCKKEDIDFALYK